MNQCLERIKTIDSAEMDNAKSGSIWQLALIGPMCVRSKAVYDLLNRQWNVIQSYRSNSSIVKRMPLMKTIMSLNNAIPNFNQEPLAVLHEVQTRLFRIRP